MLKYVPSVFLCIVDIVRLDYGTHNTQRNWKTCACMSRFHILKEWKPQIVTGHKLSGNLSFVPRLSHSGAWEPGKEAKEDFDLCEEN